MNHPAPAQQQGVCDQPPMAVPPQGLRAHDRRQLINRSLFERFQGGPELGGVQMVGVGAKGSVAQCRVAAVLGPRAAPAELFPSPLVAEPCSY